MHLDIRLPIGLLFAVLGAILTVFGLLTMFNIGADKAIYDRSLGYNINLLWGLVMLAFGAFMFFMGRRGTSAVRTAAESAEGRRLDEEERQRDSRPRGH
jgi:membrane-bound ClpP family serine protease